MPNPRTKEARRQHAATVGAGALTLPGPGGKKRKPRR